jgi:monoamine oxidase
MTQTDVIVVGGGFAGLTAARDLAEAGHRVVLVEARDRLGGRTWTRELEGIGWRAEMGGAWLEPEVQPNLVRELERYGVATKPDDRPEQLFFGHGGSRRTAEPVPPSEHDELRRAIDALSEASRGLDSGAPLAHVPAELDVPLSGWLDDLALPAATRGYLEDWMVAEFGCASAEVSLAHTLTIVAMYGHDAADWFDSLALLTKFADGTASLVDAMAAGGGFEVRLASPVAAIEQDSGVVVVRLRDGESLHASAAVVALPLNVLRDVRFDPPLSEAKRGLAEAGHAGRSVKAWALLEGVAPGTYAFGPGEELVMLATQATLGERQLAVCFGRPPLDPVDPEHLEPAIRSLLPDARVVAVDGHDWNEDEWARGTWTAHRPGALTAAGPAVRASEGHLAFAGSDLAVGWCGWIEGAIESGGRAARDVSAMLVAG